MGTNRWTYNQAVASKRTVKKDLRTQFVNNDQFINNNDKSWVLETPYEIRDTAICDLVKGVETSKQLLRNGKIKSFRMSFRSKKDPQESFVVRNRDYQSDGSGFTAFRGFFRNANVDPVIRAREPLPFSIHYDSRLIRTRLNEWFLCIPSQASMPYALGDETQVPQNRVCSLDPGVRTFQTIFDANGAVVEIGAKDLARLYRLCRQADLIQSQRAKIHGKKRYKLQRAYLRIFRRIRNLVDEVHKKLVNFLVLNYNVILLPAFETSKMVTTNGVRKLQSKTVRSMLTWSHYRFKQRLLEKSKSTAHCKVVICGEEYTSKTCTRCGSINNTLGGSKIFKCQQCALCIDRDHNGARNILLKNASHFHFGGCGVESTLLKDSPNPFARGDQI
jgi:putative transposase